MTRLPTKDFLQGWALLVAQPYGVAYRREPEAEQVQRRCWQEEFSDAPPRVWRDAVSFWVRQEDHFPLIPEMRAHITRLTPPPVPTARVALAPGPTMPVDEADLLAYAERHGVSVFVAVKQWEAVRAWVQAGRPIPLPQEPLPT